MRRFLEKALLNAGYDVLGFDNGKLAYARLLEEPFTLLLTDIVMPEMDGIELARRASELDPDLKIMFITGFAVVTLNPDKRPPQDADALHQRIVRDGEVRPDRGKEFVLRDETAGILGEVLQDREGLRPKRDLAPVEKEAPATQIQDIPIEVQPH